ncbi:MAG: hypothetical protein ACRENX_13005 [Candidatus Dormibacteria bacterium]
MAAGLVLGSAGFVVGVAAAAPVSAASLGACGSSTSLMPGNSGSCTETVSDPNTTATQVNVTLVLSTSSTSGGGTPGSLLATEAVLDGQPDGLQVTVTDETTPQTFSLGPISCYTDSSESTPASYPNAAYCASTSSSQTVASNVNNATFADTFQISWSFPLAASNPYQGSSAAVTLASTYTGTTGSGTLGASTSPHSGQLGASTPSTGAALPTTLGTLLLGAGIILAVLGAMLYIGEQRRRPVG